jgi:hypothetical protein
MHRRRKAQLQVAALFLIAFAGMLGALGPWHEPDVQRELSVTHLRPFHAYRVFFACLVLRPFFMMPTKPFANTRWKPLPSWECTILAILGVLGIVYAAYEVAAQSVLPDEPGVYIVAAASCGLAVLGVVGRSRGSAPRQAR